MFLVGVFLVRSRKIYVCAEKGKRKREGKQCEKVHANERGGEKCAFE